MSSSQVEAVSRVSRHRLLGMLLALSLTAGVLVGAPPAQAGTSACFVWANPPATDGNFVYSRGHINCRAVSGTLAVKVRGSVQEKVLSVWTVRANKYNYSAGTNYTLAARASYNCNGHGTDVYKSRGTGWDNQEDVKTRYSSELSLTC